MPVRSVACSLSGLYVRQIQNTSIRDWMIRISLINVYVFDLRWGSANTSSLLGLRSMRSRIFAKRYSYEYIKGSILARVNRTDWFFGPEVLETVYGGEVLHCRMPRPDLINIFILVSDSCIQSSPTKLTNSDQLLEASAAVLVREYYSYEVGAENLSWLLFKVTASWLGTWGETALNFSEDIAFGLISWFSLQLVTAWLFATTLKW